jgi:hypothetical protein
MSVPFDFEQLRTLIAIAETGSFTAAAGILDKTQAAVSAQIRLLEERPGREIFIREGRGSRLTEPGPAHPRSRPKDHAAIGRDARRFRRGSAIWKPLPRNPARL